MNPTIVLFRSNVQPFKVNATIFTTNKVCLTIIASLNGMNRHTLQKETWFSWDFALAKVNVSRQKQNPE